LIWFGINLACCCFGTDLGDADTSIPLPNVQSTVLEKVIEYCTWHYEHWVNPPEVREGEIERKSTDDIIPWDEAFLKVSQTTLYDLILAANFLDIKPLLDVTCKIVARGIKACQDAEDIRKYLGVKNDYTPEEEATVRKENEWIETGRLNI
jgi:S-phase kinase-associated protein 1